MAGIPINYPAASVNGWPFLFVTHDQEEAMEVSDRIIGVCCPLHWRDEYF